MPPKKPDNRKTPRKSRTETQADLQKAALDLLETRGPLAGLTLREVADHANVNRVQIYQYFGTREALLRTAIAEMLANTELDRQALRKLGFMERRAAMFEHFLHQPKQAKLEALMAQDHDEEFRVFPEIEHARRSLANDLATGALPPDADAIVAHVMTTVAYKGYCIFRENAAREIGIPLDELDRRARAVFDQMLAGIARPCAETTAEMDAPQSAEGPAAEGAPPPPGN